MQCGVETATYKHTNEYFLISVGSTGRKRHKDNKLGMEMLKTRQCEWERKQKWQKGLKRPAMLY
jgi:hypothetical protein